MDLTLPIDPSSGVPLHRQVYDSIRTAILSGKLRPGERLPATRALAETLTLSRATVAEAYDQLQTEGYIRARHGSGTFVVPDLPRAPQTPRRRDPATGRSSRLIRLSEWGERIVGQDYRALVQPGEPRSFPFDFRPHRIARDSFPWESWRASVEAALTSDRARLLEQPATAGHPELRAAIADHVARYRAVSCSPEQIVIVNGTHQGFNLLADLVLRAGEHVAVEDPGYPTARLALESRGMAISRVPVDGEGLIVDALAAAGPHRLVHVTASHQDPTGATLSLARRLAMLELAEGEGMLIVEDDYDSEFRFEGRPVESLQGLDRNGLVVYAGSFSKSVFPSLRMGYLVLPISLVDPFVAAKALRDGGTPLLEQAALLQFMRSGDYERHIRKMRRLYRSRRDALVEALKNELGKQAAIGERHGGLNLLVTLDLPLTDAEIVARAAEAGIGLRSAMQYFSRPPSAPTLLLGFGEMDEERIREGIRQLSRSVAGPSRRHRG